MLEVKNLCAGYGKKEILHQISFSVQAHEIVGILGANGSGKTTLLKALCAIQPSQGEIRLLGQDIRTLSARQIAKLSRYIPQRSGISIDISVLDVVLMGFNPQLGLLEAPTPAMRSAAIAALERVGMQERVNHNFQVLSEGQKQLCILARTMLLQRGILFLDEPESALDFSGRYRILELVRQWMSEREGSALVTLHDPQLALNHCDRLVLLKDGCLFTSLSPKVDSPALMEEKLSQVFGPLSICQCVTRNKQRQLVILKEE